MARQDHPGEPPQPWWQDWRVAVGAALALLLLIIGSLWLAVKLDIAEGRREMLERQAAEGFLRPPSSSRTAPVDLDNPATVTLGAGPLPERVELRIAARTSRFNTFRVAITRNDGVEVLHVDRLQRDSNGELRLAINSSLLPEGGYTVQVEGFTWRGETLPVGRFALQR
jgi:hypothetical protein